MLVLRPGDRAIALSVCWKNSFLQVFSDFVLWGVEVREALLPRMLKLKGCRGDRQYDLWASVFLVYFGFRFVLFFGGLVMDLGLGWKLCRFRDLWVRNLQLWVGI